MNCVVCRFQQYFSHITATVQIIHVFPWFHQYKPGALKCLAQGHSHEKTWRLQYGSNPGPLDYESNTSPLSHAGPAVDYCTRLLVLYIRWSLCGVFRVLIIVLTEAQNSPNPFQLPRPFNVGKMYQHKQLPLIVSCLLFFGSWRYQVAAGDTKLQLEIPSCSWRYQVAVGDTKLQLEIPSCSWRYQVVAAIFDSRHIL